MDKNFGLSDIRIEIDAIFVLNAISDNVMVNSSFRIIIANCISLVRKIFNYFVEIMNLFYLSFKKNPSQGPSSLYHSPFKILNVSFITVIQLQIYLISKLLMLNHLFFWASVGIRIAIS